MPTRNESNNVNVNLEEIDPRCVVKFRPSDDWEGQYGFDWFREGDCEEKPNDVNIYSYPHYKDLIGIYCSNRGQIIRKEGYINKSVKYDLNPLTLYRHVCHKIVSLPNCKVNGVYVFFAKQDDLSPYRKLQMINQHLRFISEERFEYDQNNHTMTNLDGGTSYQGVSEDSVFYWDSDGDNKITVDPDNCDSAKFKCDETIKGDIFNADRFAKKNYSRIKFNDNTGNYYCVPHLSLFYENNDNMVENREEWGCTKAIVKLIITAENVSSIDFLCDDHIGAIEIEPKTIQNPFPNPTITIRFVKPFYLDECKSIKAIAHHEDGSTTLAGQINIIRCVPKTVKKICLVNVGIRFNSGSQYEHDNNISIHKKNLRRFFAQAHVIIPEKRIVEQEFLISFDTNSLYLGYTTTKDGEDVLCKYAPNKKESLGQLVEKEFNKNFKHLKNYLKIFFCSKSCVRSCNDLSELGGHAVDIPSKSVIIFKNDPNKPEEAFLPCHELLHSFGLYHTFSNRSLYTFEKFQTSNIMDYPGGIRQKSLWYWQWNLIRQSKEVDDSFFWKYWLTRQELSKL